MTIKETFEPSVLWQATTQLKLDANEGKASQAKIPQLDSAANLALYPEIGRLERSIAKLEGVAPSRILAGAGGDDLIERIIRLAIDDQRIIVIHRPTFGMIEDFIARYGAKSQAIEWRQGVFPFAELEEKIAQNRTTVFLVSPNNPTGLTIDSDKIVALARRYPATQFVVDLAYIDFATIDPCSELIQYDNILVLKTFSKSWGLAGLRVGYLIAEKSILERLALLSGPYPISSLSAFYLQRLIDSGATANRDYIEAVIQERPKLRDTLLKCGFEVLESEANFVLASGAKAEFLATTLKKLNVLVRSFPERPGLKSSLRISCPGSSEEFNRLINAIEFVLAPQAILFDLDGVIADVSASYRQCIVQTAASFGLEVSSAMIDEIKIKGHANSDYQVTSRLLIAAGMTFEFSDLQRRFDAFYQGEAAGAGLEANETLLLSGEFLRSLAKRCPMAIVTGRPRRDAEVFLSRFDLEDCFEVVITAEDTPLPKPNPDPILKALDLLGVERAWMIGDTPDDMAAAAAAFVIGIGFAPACVNPDANTGALLDAGAVVVAADTQQLGEILS